MPIALITGTTAGIGKATAEILAENGFDVIINGRRADELETVKEELLKKYTIHVLALPFDVRHQKTVESAIKELPDDWKHIDVLVNNAGLGLGMGPVNEGIPEDWDTMIDTNIKGLLWVTHAVLPGMIARKSGHIVNLGSIAGKEVYAGGNVYCMTKHAVDAVTKAMRIDLLPHGIRVTGIHPGKVETEFSMVRYKGDKERAEKDYVGYEPLHAKDVAETILFAVTRPPHVTINELTVMPTAQANTVHLLKK
jgi:NADP-dependent 3-hydroxy acid dehydrogenase YdfG